MEGRTVEQSAVTACAHFALPPAAFATSPPGRSAGVFGDVASAARGRARDVVVVPTRPRVTAGPAPREWETLMDYTTQHRRRCPDCGEHRPVHEFKNPNGAATPMCTQCRHVSRWIAGQHHPELALDEDAHDRDVGTRREL